MPTPQQLFERKVRQLVREARMLSPQARRQVLELLDEARRQILGRLASIDPESFSAAQLRELQGSIDQAMEQFRRGAALEVNRLQEATFRQASLGVDATLVEIGFEPIALGRVNPTTLAIAQGYTADLITGLSEDAKAKVNAAIQRAFLGGQSLDDIIAQVGRGVDRRFTGLFSSIGQRAAGIATNEILRVHSISAQERLEQVAERNPELEKQWQWVPAAKVPRPSHQRASGQVRPVKKKFDVGGEQLMFPRDPAGSARNTINCHCVVKPFLSKDALQATPGQRGLLREIGVEVTRA